MKRMIKSSITHLLTEKELLSLLDEAANQLRRVCEDRGQGEYVDDVKWGKDRFEIPIFISLRPGLDRKVAVFTYVFDPDEREYSAEDQLHVQLDEFLEIWNGDDEEDEMTGADFIESAISDVTYDTWRELKGNTDYSMNDIVNKIISDLSNPPYNLEEGEDFEKEDVQLEVDDYFWD